MPNTHPVNVTITSLSSIIDGGDDLMLLKGIHAPPWELQVSMQYEVRCT